MDDLGDIALIAVLGLGGYWLYRRWVQSQMPAGQPAGTGSHHGEGPLGGSIQPPTKSVADAAVWVSGIGLVASATKVGGGFACNVIGIPGPCQAIGSKVGDAIYDAGKWGVNAVGDAASFAWNNTLGSLF